MIYANYEYTLTGQQQSEIQMFLRRLPAKLQDTDAWSILHSMTYANSWTQEPEHGFIDVPEEVLERTK